MKKLLVALILFPVFAFAQYFESTTLATLPEPVSNNTICGIATENGFKIYSFGGINNTKSYDGIHDKVFCYNSETNAWTEIGNLPDGGGRIAAGASTIKDKIYVVGGYEVFANGNEKSFTQNHVFDVQADTFMQNAAPLPLAIDDHVQAVWRDSLLFVITGWSNTTNRSDVQIFNPSTDTWGKGTDVPDNNDYKVFGGSGTIIGDTIFYLGGARLGSSFPATRYFRKGVINPNNPTEITWSGFMQSEAKGYRMAAINNGGTPLWFGGSLTTYNYDGVAYNGSGPVASRNRVIKYDFEKGELEEISSLTTKIMDLRGAYVVGRDSFIVAGGMLDGTIVTDSVFLITGVDLHLSTRNLLDADITVSPNPCNGIFHINSKTPIKEIKIFDLKGNRIQFGSQDSTDSNFKQKIKINSGEYIIQITTTNNQVITQTIISHE